MKTSMSQVYLNGEFLPTADAKVSVLDRGFLFGDGVYEVIPVFHGRALAAHEHLQRLNRSLQAIHLDSLHSDEEWLQLFSRLLELNSHSGSCQAIYLQITRGAGPVRKHHFPENTPPTVLLMAMPFQPRLGTGADETPAGRAISAPDKRWQRCDIKSTSLLGNLMHHQGAVEADVDEALLIDDQGLVTEGSSSNVFVVIDSVIITPPVSDKILAGITRHLVLALAREDGRYSCEERELRADELKQADEIWITSSSREILPIIELDKQTVGTGVPGPVWQHIAGIYLKYRDAGK